MDECREHVQDMIVKIMILGMIVFALLAWHFCLVIYQHWKNANTLPKMLGGLLDDDGVNGAGVRPFEDEDAQQNPA